ncbi:MAG: hypothetical protein NVS3B17_14560 [Vulcanimicrobiaceae bacterium]
MKLALFGTLSLSVVLSNVAPTFAQTSSSAASHRTSHVVAAKPIKVSMKDLAPADEYFGPLKMSFLGISNAMNNIKRRQSTGDMNDDTEKSLNQVENSIRDWAKQYPRDPYVAGALLQLHKTYAMFPDARAHTCAVASAMWLLKQYPHSKQAKEAHRLLASAATGENTLAETR